MTRNQATKKLVILAMISALAYILVVVLRISFIPSATYLKLDIKDVPIAMAGIIFGPLSAVLVSFAVSFIEMITVSDSGPIGFIMNFLSTVGFVLPISFFYKKNKTLKAAVFGLSLGVVLMTVLMILWNIFFTPVYMGVPVEVVIDMIIPVFLPFNFIKGTINAVIVFMMYKPFIQILRKTNSLPKVNTEVKTVKKRVIYANFIALIILIIAITVIIIFMNS